MKKLLLSLTVPLILSACGGNSGPVVEPNPNPGGGTPAPSYPYNPQANGTESADTRIPYRGEWRWAVALSDTETYVGRISISERMPSVTAAGFTNVGGGPGAVCPNRDLCSYTGEFGLIGTHSDASGSALVVALSDSAAAQNLRFLGQDDDGVVGTEVTGQPSLVGGGVWQTASGQLADMGFAVVQANADAPVTASAVGPSSALMNRLPTRQVLRTQSVSALEQRAVEVLKKTF